MRSFKYALEDNQPYVFFNDQELLLLPEKAIYSRSHKALFIADPHFGKAAHFRKAGIPIPELLHWEDLEIIRQLILRYETNDIFFLGDLFHSKINDSWEHLINFMTEFPFIFFHLVKGNHDEYLPKFSPNPKLIFHSEPIQWKGLWLSHEPSENFNDDLLNLCGHIHPGVLINGGLRQKLRLPCFYWNKKSLILPAFGKFTGLHLLNPSQDDMSFAIAGKKVIPFKLL